MSKISHWYKWAVTKRKDGTKRIRRYRKVNDKIVWESYPTEKFEGYSDQEIHALLNKLNATLVIEENEAKARYDFDYSYINKLTISEFEKHLSNLINDKNHITTSMTILNEYTFNFFIHKMKVPDPNKWLKFEDNFVTFLLKDKKSTSYLKRIIQTTNRFLKFLHKKYPNEVNLIVLEPISKVKFKNQDTDERLKYISEAQYNVICEKIDSQLLIPFKISYHFGLRCAEVLGLEAKDVFEDCLDVNRQLIKLEPIKNTGPLKNKTKRSVPYWFASPEDIYEWIESMTLMHPDTLSRKFALEMERLKLPFEFHDLRRTFITRALRSYNIRDVQLAAGHSDLKTTMLYAQDDRQLQRKPFKPKKSDNSPVSA